MTQQKQEKKHPLFKKKKGFSWKNILPFILIFLLSFGIAVIYVIILTAKLPIRSVDFASNSDYSVEISKVVNPSPTPFIKPELVQYAAYPPPLSAQSALAMDEKTGWILYSKDATTPLWPASTTKIMTALVALEHYDLDEIVTIQNPIAEGSTMDLIQNERISVENLLYGLLIQSANDAAFALADHFQGGRDAFVSAMNDKALQLSLVNTHYTDPAGFDNTKQYSTAQDLASLTRAALSNSTIKKMVGIPEITVPDEDFTVFHKLKNVNQLLGKVPGVAGVKTGWTENAKENLVNLTKRNSQTVLTVVLGSNDRFNETQKLTDWVFANYTWPPESTSNL
jgi:D-alanyl-D-alanine carboxypeptidase